MRRDLKAAMMSVRATWEDAALHPSVMRYDWLRL